MKANSTIKNMRSLKEDKRAVAAQLGMVIALLVSILVGVLIYYKTAPQIFQSVGSSDVTTYGKLARAQLNSTNTTASTTFTLAPIIAIVLIAGIILAIVTRFGQGGGI